MSDHSGTMDPTRGVDALEEHLSTPPACLVDLMARLDGDVVVLGAAGKMGPTLARMAARALAEAGRSRRVIGVARFSSPGVRESLERHGVETIRGDLLDRAFLRTLPDSPNVVFAAGMKFGATGNEPLTWAMNTHLPTLVCERFPGSRIVAFSTGNVYGATPVARGSGSCETDPVHPVGEYAMSCLGRERIFEYFSREHGTPVAIARLNYAVELRYGVLLDLARKVWDGTPVDLTMGHVNVIWQSDANSMALGLLGHVSSPGFIVNIAGPAILTVRGLCERFGELLHRQARFVGTEAPDSLLSDSRKAYGLVGAPEVGIDEMVRWTADWVRMGGETLGKPTHFQVRDGRF